MIHRFLEVHQVHKRLETVLEQLGSLYKFHGMYSRNFLWDECIYFYSSYGLSFTHFFSPALISMEWRKVICCTYIVSRAIQGHVIAILKTSALNLLIGSFIKACLGMFERTYWETSHLWSFCFLVFFLQLHIIIFFASYFLWTIGNFFGANCALSSY